MKEDENESLEVFKQKISLMPELAYFRKNYWKQRYQIFNELYKILYNNEEKIDEKETKDIQLKDLDSDMIVSVILKITMKIILNFLMMIISEI